MRKAFFWVFVILLAGSGCAPKQQAIDSSSLPEGMRSQEGQKEDGMDQKMLTFTFSEYTNDGKKKMEIEGDSADIFSDSVDLTNIIARIHSTNQQVTVTSKEGTFDRATNNIQLVNHVVARGEDGSTITSDSMNYDADSGIGTTDDFTKITRADMISIGIGALVNSKARQAQLNEYVWVWFGTGSQDSRHSTIVTCDGSLHVDHEKRLAVFNNNVEVKDARGTLQGDRMEVYLEEEEKEISRIICEGNVRIRQGENETFSDRAIYLAKEGRVVLTGAPRLVLYTDELKETDALIRSTGPGQDL